MKQVKEGLIVLAFCWAHQRRDFLDVARSWPSEEEWAFGWVERIRQLYKANDARLEVAEGKPLEFAARDSELRQHVEQLAEQAKQELADPKLYGGPHCLDQNRAILRYTPPGPRGRDASVTRRLGPLALARWPALRYIPCAGRNGGGLCWRATRQGITRPTVRRKAVGAPGQ
jgi:hypothetical protein